MPSLHFLCAIHVTVKQYWKYIYLSLLQHSAHVCLCSSAVEKNLLWLLYWWGIPHRISDFPASPYSKSISTFSWTAWNLQGQISEYNLICPFPFFNIFPLQLLASMSGPNYILKKKENSNTRKLRKIFRALGENRTHDPSSSSSDILTSELLEL